MNRETSESSEDEFNENYGEHGENSGDFDGNFGDQYAFQKQTSFFPTPPHTPIGQQTGEERCSPCTNEVGARKAKKTRRARFKC